MSIIQMETAGENTGRVVDEFTGLQLSMTLTDPPDKHIFIKLTPGTDLFNKVVECSQHLEVTPTKAARILMKAGHLGYTKSRIVELKRVKK